MFERSGAIALLVSSVAVSACASGHSAPPSARQQAAEGNLGPAFLEWTGKFQTTLSATKSITGSSRQVVHGGVRLTAVDQNMLRAEITFSADMSTPLNDNYKWSISSGECHSPTIPLLPVSEFPPLSITNNRGTLDVRINLPLPTAGRYHVNVYWTDGADEGDVMTCADLKVERRVDAG